MTRMRHTSPSAHRLFKLAYFSFLALMPLLTAAHQHPEKGMPANRDLVVWEDTLKELLQKLSQNGSLPPPSGEMRRRLLNAVLQTLTVDGQLLPAGDRSLPLPRSVEVFSEILRKDADDAPGFLFLRPSAICADVSIPIRSKLDLAGTSVVGTIIDLRSLAGDGVGSVNDCVSVVKRMKVPVAVLVNNNTSRAAESLAHSLRQNCGAVLLGSATKGMPFAGRSLALKGGERVRISAANGVNTQPQYTAPSPITPDVLLPQSDSSSRPKTAISSSSRMEHDEGVRRAIDLLTTIWALATPAETVPDPHADEQND